MNSQLVAVIILIVIYIVLCRIAFYIEKKEFNNGVCIRCGEKLEYFDMTSQGDRGYICNKCGHIVWVSHKVDEKHIKED